MVVNTQAQTGLIYDQYSAVDFKFAAIDAIADQVIIGHHTARAGWVMDQVASQTMDAGVDYTFEVTMRGTTVTVKLNDQTIVGYSFNAVTVDGHFGLYTRNTATTFDNVTLKTDDASLTKPNRPPVANNDAAATTVSTPVVIPVLTNDADLDGDALTIVSSTAAAYGALRLNADSTFTYTPNQGYTGSDQFIYIISDGVSVSSAATVSIQVGGASNTPPVAKDDTASTTKSVSVTINVLANDTDAENNPLTTVIAGMPSNGSVLGNKDGTITYRPNAGFAGTDSFTYRASDGIAQSAPATVTVAIRNQAPLAGNDTARTTRAPRSRFPSWLTTTTRTATTSA